MQLSGVSEFEQVSLNVEIVTKKNHLCVKIMSRF